MKELILLRHAKSSWARDELDDFDRPLNGRGLREAPLAAAALAAQCAPADRLLTSPAVRAYHTALFLRKAWNLDWDRFQLRPAVYEAPPGDLLRVLADLPDEAGRVALVGHNPGLSLLLEHLTGAGPELKTACAARIAIRGDWSGPEPGKGELIGGKVISVAG
ncbi:MAG: SixA phosphatase family protein [Puniceicoccaceae bacterium]